jgi:coenzyme F420-reducing hydrogenase beta subunit
MSQSQQIVDELPIVPPPSLTRIGDNECTGCSACANACPQHAIEMLLNRHGFYRPSLRDGQCDECRLCLKRCPVIAVMTSALGAQPLHGPDVFAAWTTDESVHRTSSSGGVFSELARLVLQQGGVVCGCEWGANWTPRHVIIRDWEGVSRLRGSKYIPSFVGDGFYREVIEIAQSGTPVLFCGTPCQVAGLKLIAPPVARQHILLVDLVCHGVPSLTSFWRYLDWKFGSCDDVTHFSFRNKERSVATICAMAGSGNKYLANVGADPWYRMGMVNHFFLQGSCFECRFSVQRHSDISLGDFWGIPDDWHNQLGDSVVLLHTSKGLSALRQLICMQQVASLQSDFDMASSKSGRLRGVRYPMPMLRTIALYMLAKGCSFSWMYYFIYLPTRLVERGYGYIRHRYDRLRHACAGFLN